MRTSHIDTMKLQGKGYTTARVVPLTMNATLIQCKQHRS
jgi:hypothetical protein